MHPWELWVALGVPWEELGGRLAPSDILWGSIGGPRGSLGGSWGVPCRSLMGRRLVLKIIQKRFVCSTFLSMEAPWGTPWRSLEVLVPSLEILVPLLGCPGRFLGRPWDLVEVLGCLWGVLGTLWVSLDVSMGSTGGP